VLTIGWLRARDPRVICDVCFQRVNPGAPTCPHCGTPLGDPNREPHAVLPETWVDGQIRRLRAMAYQELRAMVDAPEQYEVPVDDGDLVLIGETTVFWDDPRKAEGDLRVRVGIWRDASRRRALASDEFIRAPDGSFIGE
jgi:hypothetical protein